MNILQAAVHHPFASVSIITIILTFLNQKIRQIVFYALSRVLFVFVRRTYIHATLGDAFIVYLQKNGYKSKKLTGELYGEDPAFIKSENEIRHVLYRDFRSNTQAFYGKGLWPIVVSGVPLTHHKDMVINYSYIIYTVRGSVDITKLLDQATEGKNYEDEDEKEVNQFCIKRVSGNRFFKEQAENKAEVRTRNKSIIVSENELCDPFSPFEPVKWEKKNIGQEIRHNTLELMSLNPELEDVLEEIKFWANSREFYENRGILWRRGYAFVGSPGTGKTLFSKAIAQTLNMPLIIFDLASMSNTELIETWGQLLPRRIALFEDFDTIFDKRTNLTGNELTFDCFLNILNGVDSKEGILTILTTNFPEKLDPALGGPLESEMIDGKKVEKIAPRPGRIDRIVEFFPLDRKGRMKVAMRILRDEKMAEKIVDESAHLSAAQLQEKCFRVAVDVLFKSRKKMREIPTVTS